MEGDMTQDAVLHFLQSRGGSVKNAELLQHFGNHIRYHADRDRNRELFKRFVNSVATVRQEDGVSYVVLRKKFRGHVPGDGCPRTGPAPPGEADKQTVLPAAGIIVNNNNSMETNYNLRQGPQLSGPPVPGQCTVVAQQRLGVGAPPGGPPAVVHPAAAAHPEVGYSAVRQPAAVHPAVVHPAEGRPEVRQSAVVLPTVGHPAAGHPEAGYSAKAHPAVRQPVLVHPTVGHPGVVNPAAGRPEVRQPAVIHPTVGHPGVVNPAAGRPEVRQPAVIHPTVGHPGVVNPAAGHPEVRQPVVIHPTVGHPAAGHHEVGYSAKAHPAVRQPVLVHPAVGRPEMIHPAVGRPLDPGPVPQPLRTGGLHHEPPPPGSQMVPHRHRYRPSYKSAVSYDDDEEEEEEEEEVRVRRGSTGGAWPPGVPLEGTVRTVSASSPCIIDSAAASFSSSPSEMILPKIYIQDLGGEMSSPDPACHLESGAELRGPWAAPGAERVNSRPLEADRHQPSPERLKGASPNRGARPSPSSGPQLEPRTPQSRGACLSSSHSDVFSPCTDASSDWPPSGSSRGSGRSNSYEALQEPAAETGRGTIIQDVPQRAHRTQSVSNLTEGETTAGRHHGDRGLPAHLSAFHHSADHLHGNQDSQTRRAVPWHLSTGDLYDSREEAESSDGSTFSPPMRPAGVARRLSSQVRSRMCRSMGADLDQLLQEEARGGGGGGGSEAARLNRLHMISSSLSLHYNLSSSSLSSCSTPPRCSSLADLAEVGERVGGARRSLPSTSSATMDQQEAPSKPSLVPLEPSEHEWLVKAAAGAWPDIYSLFREEPSLLNKQDFISGFTVLHWIAKHGDHRVLNTLWYGVQKAGLMFDVNARSTCGHTPLHIAAIHGHKNIMRLLVGKFGAEVALRDTAGKKAWQYLSRAAPLDIFQLLAAPARVALGQGGGVRKEDASWEQQQQQQQQQQQHQQRRRRRHHFSTASSGQRPLTAAGTVRVKRSSSIAALLKHKSLSRFYGQKSDPSV